MTIPKNLNEAVDELERLFESNISEIDDMVNRDDMCAYHHSTGRGMRNEWGLWHGSELKTFLEDAGFTHPDDMSGFILDSLWNKRHSIPNDKEWYNSQVEIYRKHWEKYK